jgi:hypothetical protein
MVAAKRAGVYICPKQATDFFQIFFDRAKKRNVFLA